MIYVAFVVSHELTIKVNKLDGIGKMTDKLLKTGENHITIDCFEWKAENVTNIFTDRNKIQKDKL